MHNGRPGLTPSLLHPPWPLFTYPSPAPSLPAPLFLLVCFSPRNDTSDRQSQKQPNTHIQQHAPQHSHYPSPLSKKLTTDLPRILWGPGRNGARPRGSLIDDVPVPGAAALGRDGSGARNLAEVDTRVVCPAEPVVAPVAAGLERRREAIAGGARSDAAVSLAPAVAWGAVLVGAG